MRARNRRAVSPRPHAAARPDLRACSPRGDEGFTLIEVMVSIALIGILMTALTSFFMATTRIGSEQSRTQVAIQLTGDALDRARSLKGSEVAVGRDQTSVQQQLLTPVTGVAAHLSTMQPTWDPAAAAPAGATASLPTTPLPLTVNKVDYDQNWYVGSCWQAPVGGDCAGTAVSGHVQFFRIVVAVTWPARNCVDLCVQIASTLVSSASDDPVFNSNRTAQPPAVSNPGPQLSAVGAPINNLQLVSAGGAPAITWSYTGLPPGVTDSGALLSGTPSIAGVYTVTASARDAFGLVGTAAFIWTVNPPAALTSPGNQRTWAGDPVSFTIGRSGGVPPYVFAATGLPAGVTIDTATGTISGTTTTATAGTNVVVTMTDTTGRATTTSFTWTVLAPPMISGVPATATVDTTGNISTVQATASGGTGPYSWSVTGLPTGLIFDATGRISGKVTAGTRFVSVVTVTDAVGGTASATTVWTVTPKNNDVRITAPVGDRAGDRVGQPVTFTAQGAGGTGTGWVWSPASLPPGITMSANTVAGTPTVAGRYVVTLTLRDSAGQTATFMFVWTIQ